MLFVSELDFMGYPNNHFDDVKKEQVKAISISLLEKKKYTLPIIHVGLITSLSLCQGKITDNFKMTGKIPYIHVNDFKKRISSYIYIY